MSFIMEFYIDNKYFHRFRDFCISQVIN